MSFNTTPPTYFIWFVKFHLATIKRFSSSIISISLGFFRACTCFSALTMYILICFFRACLFAYYWPILCARLNLTKCKCRVPIQFEYGFRSNWHMNIYKDTALINYHEQYRIWMKRGPVLFHLRGSYQSPTLKTRGGKHYRILIKPINIDKHKKSMKIS